MEKLTFKEMQSIAANILKEFAALCNKLGLRYSIAYGSLIGAVRHHGFIPWDDDVDVWMPRPDFEKLVKYWQENEEHLMPYKLMNTDNDPDYPHMITRIVDTRTWIDVVNEKDCGLGLFVDIYVHDGLGDNFDEATAYLWKSRRNSSLFFLSVRDHFHIGLTKGLKIIIKYPAYLYAKLRGKRHFIQRAKQLCQALDYENSKYVACVCWCSYRPPRELLKKEWLEELIELDFEGFKVKAPKRYHEVLTHIYGDYMKLPPEKDRIAHHLYTAYRK